MTRFPRAARRPARALSVGRKGLSPLLLALALAFPGVPHPMSLEDLLRLPLECLLQLEISPRPVQQSFRHAASRLGRLAADRGLHAV